MEGKGVCEWTKGCLNCGQSKCYVYGSVCSTQTEGKTAESTANHIHSISFAYEADRDPARALDKRKKMSGCGSM